MNEKDPLHGLKYVAYCRSQTPPDEAGWTIEDLVQYARYYVSNKKNLLFSDPIWNNLTKEEILIEYFCLRFDEDETFRGEFIAQLRGVKEDDYAWFEKMEKQHLEKTKDLEEIDEDFTK